MNYYNMNQTETEVAQLTKKEAERLLANEVQTILCRHFSDRLQWTGSTIDLMEALYVAYLTASLLDEEGNYLSFRQIVERGCSILHAKVPRNPYDVARRGTLRKGLKCKPYLERYLWQKQHRPQSRPFCQLITQL